MKCCFYIKSYFNLVMTVFLTNINMFTFPFKEEEELHPKMLAAARKSGQLNLSNRGLVAVPEKVGFLFDY